MTGGLVGVEGVARPAVSLSRLDYLTVSRACARSMGRDTVLRLVLLAWAAAQRPGEAGWDGPLMVSM